MAFERIDYPRRDWTPGAHPLEEKKTAALGRATMLRFSPGFADPHWCDNGHAGYVIEGRLRLEFEHESCDFGPGEGFVVETGTRHRAANAGAAPVVIFVASYDASASAASTSR